MPDYDRRADDEWRGRTAARVKAIEDRLSAQDDRMTVLGEAITAIRIDMSALRTEQTAMREDIHEIADTVKEDSKARAQDRSDLIDDLQETLRQKGLKSFQWALIIIGAFLTAIVGPLVVAALTGHLG